VGKIDREK